LSAAVWLSRYLHSVVLIDGGDPRNWETRGIHGILGFHGVRPAELRARGREESRRFGTVLVDGMVDRVRSEENDSITLELRDGQVIKSSRLLLAIGIKDFWPDVPGLDPCYGESAHVCPDCDGYEARGKKTVVVGSGRRSVGMALALTTWTNQIVICTNGMPAELDAEALGKADAANIPILEMKIQRIRSEGGEIRGLELEDGMHLDCERLFFTIGQYPADDLGVQLGCKRDVHGAIIVDEHHHTSVTNVYAAGDVTPGPQLAVRAEAGGAVAALSIHRSLVPEARRLD
jgi:thioredoxin reductase